MMFSDWDRDIEIAAAEARERIDAIRDDLPDDLQRYFVWKWSTSDEPVLRVAPGQQALDLTRRIRPDRPRVQAPARAHAGRGDGRSRRRAAERGRDRDRPGPPDRARPEPQRPRPRACSAVNFSVSAGQIDDGGRRLRVQPVGELTDLQQLRDLVDRPTACAWRDVADVRLKPETHALRPSPRRPPGGRHRHLQGARRQPGRGLAQRALAEVDTITRRAGAAAASRSRSSTTRARTSPVRCSSLAEAGGIGLLLSIAVLYFFLRHWPSTLMVTLAIPICFVMTLGFMYFAGVTLNVLSMMGLLLAVGMLVDNAVVVVESIYQERETHARRAAAGLDHRHAPRRHRAVGGHAVPLHRVRAEPVRRDATSSASTWSQIAITISRVAAGLVAGRGEPDPDAVGAHEDAAGGAQRQGRDPAPAAPLRRLAALDAGAPRLERARHPADRRGRASCR